MDITNQQLKYIKDYAEQRAINRFTTAKISVDMSNVINGSSKADMEGIVTHLKTRLEEEMSAVAEGVHRMYRLIIDGQYVPIPPEKISIRLMVITRQ